MENLCIDYPKLLLIEPFYGGSHKELIDVLTENFVRHGIQYTLVTLPAKKWHWRARCSALILYDKIPKISTEVILFCSSVLNLAELLGLRPDLCSLKKVVYFHENQLIYPIRHVKLRDVQYPYNEITTSLAADLVLFNSNFNRSSFLENINKIIKLFPDHRPQRIKERIELKSKVLYFPVKLPNQFQLKPERLDKSVLHIVWPHRWEFDKGPEDFFNTLIKLSKEKCQFRLSVLGETYTDNCEIFKKAKEELADKIINFGFVESKTKYFEVLNSSHIVVSTAKHEFFGVSILEATYCGCLPLVPMDLVYPEIYPHECLYKDLEQLLILLKRFCLNPNEAIKLRSKLDFNFERYSVETLVPQYISFLGLNT